MLTGLVRLISLRPLLVGLWVALLACPSPADDDDSTAGPGDDDDSGGDDDDSGGGDDDDSPDDDDSAEGEFHVFTHWADCGTKDEFPGWELHVQTTIAHPGGPSAITEVALQFDPQTPWVDLSSGPREMDGPGVSPSVPKQLGYWAGIWVESILFYDKNIPPAGCITADGTPYTISATDADGTVIEATGTIEL